MKKPFSLIILLFVAFSLWSQSTDLDKEYIDVSYVKLPTKPILNDADRTFSVLSLNSPILTQSLPELYFESEIKLSGFTKLNRDAFLKVESKLIDVTLISSETKSQQKSSTDEDGKVTRWTEYTGIVKYRTEGSVTITSVDNTVNETFTFNREKTINSKTSKSYKDAEYFRKSNTTKTLRINFVKHVINVINNRMAILFGYTIETKKSILWILDSKKHPEIENHKSNYNLIKEAFSNMQSHKPIDDLKTKIEPAITYFKSVLSNYPGKDRKSRKLRYASLYNIAWLNYYLDNPDAALDYANQLIENDYDKSDGKALIKKANQLKNSFQVNNTKTRHFEIITEDKTDYYGINNNVTFEQGPNKPFNPKEDPDYSLSFVITNAGDTIPSYVNVPKINTVGGILKAYVKDFEGKVVPRSFGAHEVEVLLLGNGEKRYTVPFKQADDAISASTFDRASYKYAKRIYHSKKISLYEYQGNELVIKKSKDKKGFSTSSAGWLMAFRKKLNGLVEESCIELKERVKAKEFDNNARSIIEFMKAYNECN